MAPLVHEGIILAERHGIKVDVTGKHGDVNADALSWGGLRQGGRQGKRILRELTTVGRKGDVFALYSPKNRTRQMIVAGGKGAQLIGLAHKRENTETLMANTMLTVKKFAADAAFGISPRRDADLLARRLAKLGDEEFNKAVNRGEDVGYAETPDQMGQRLLKGAVAAHAAIDPHYAGKDMSHPLPILAIATHAPLLGQYARMLGVTTRKELIHKPEQMGEAVRVDIYRDTETGERKAIARFRNAQNDVTHLFPHLNLR